MSVWLSLYGVSACWQKCGRSYARIDTSILCLPFPTTQVSKTWSHRCARFRCDRWEGDSYYRPKTKGFQINYWKILGQAFEQVFGIQITLYSSTGTEKYSVLYMPTGSTNPQKKYMCFFLPVCSISCQTTTTKPSTQVWKEDEGYHVYEIICINHGSRIALYAVIIVPRILIEKTNLDNC